MYNVPVRALAPLVGLSLLSTIATAEVVFSEDFDGGGVNSVFNFTNASGDPGAVVESGLVSQGMVAKLTSISASNNNALAFDSFSLQGEQATISFEFRMSTDAENTGCCVEAADGFGIGFFDTGTYGTTGAINPTAGTTALWEDPTVGDGFPAAVYIGFDIFEANDIKITGAGGPTEVVGTFVAPFPLNDGLFHRAVLTFNAQGADSELSIDLFQDINGNAPTEHSIAAGLTLTGIDLGAISSRVIAGGRTGGAFVETFIDNIVIETFQGDDSDSDGIPDFWEVQNGLDKDDPEDADDDPDGDLLDNLGEFKRSSDPNDPDSDDDTLSDLVETKTGTWVDANNRGTDPRSGDSDLDGLGDAVETNTGTFTNASMTGTNPNVVDSDNDTFSDGLEVTAGSDPTNPNSFPQTPSVLGIGTAALLGSDLTDPENDGDPEAELNYNAIFAASEEAAFAGGESAFNVFDNEVGGGNTKWCCGDGADFPTNPIWVSATFEEPIVLTHFTLTSGNDTPGRAPRVWEIQGSNDETNFETIHRQDDPGSSVWGGTINQVLRWDAGVQFVEPDAYTTIRFICFATGSSSGARYQLNEIELFGMPGNTTPFAITSIVLNEAGDVATITWKSRPNRIYAFDHSDDMKSPTGSDAWSEEFDDMDSEGDFTSHDFAIPAGTDRLFFQIRDVTNP